MMEIDDGGAAFPNINYVGPGEGIGTSIMTIVGGMTLRDYFAGQALMGLLAHRGYEFEENDCADCYKYADAMIQAKAATKG